MEMREITHQVYYSITGSFTHNKETLNSRKRNPPKTLTPTKSTRLHPTPILVDSSIILTSQVLSHNMKVFRPLQHFDELSARDAVRNAQLLTINPKNTSFEP